jgi:predicted DNA-binding transcriptional regulator AlpA
LTVGELRELVGEVVEQKLRRLSTARPGGLLNAEQAAEFLGYSKDWVYKNWQKVGGKKIGGKGLRFDAAELQSWVESRNGA